jgi:protein gp37
MATDTKIEWADHTFNPWIGCTKVGPGCDHCYAEARMDTRYHKVRWGAGEPRRRTSEHNWKLPPSWNRRAEAEGVRRRVFCASLADVFDNEVDPQWRAELFALIERTQSLDWLLLTKRIGNAKAMLPQRVLNYVTGQTEPATPCNVWLGATVVNQEEADRDIPKLLATPAAVRFLSVEPILSDIRLGQFLQRSPSAAFASGRVTPEMPAWTRIGSTAIDWVIVGGESGPKARPTTIGHIRSVVQQCKSASVPVFVKQLGARPVNREGVPHPLTHAKGGAIEEWPEDLRVREFPSTSGG